MRRFGTVHSCIILKEGGRSRGFGFVTFSSHEVARQVAHMTHTIFGKEFGCNLIMPNRDAKHHQNDKKNRKVYIKVKDKTKLDVNEVDRIFSRYGRIADITILKESKERSGFVQFDTKESVERLLAGGPIPYKDTFLTCEACLSRKEVKKTKKPTALEAPVKGGITAPVGNGTHSVLDTSYTNREWPNNKVPIYPADYHDEQEDDYYEDFVDQNYQTSKNVHEKINRQPRGPTTLKIEIPPENYLIGKPASSREHVMSVSAIEFRNVAQSKNPYLIELVKPPSDDEGIPLPKKTRSTGNDDDSAKLFVGARSQEGGISKSPRDSHAENSGTNFLVIPRVGTTTVASGDKLRIPILRIKTGSIEELMQTKELELFPERNSDHNEERLPSIAVAKSRDLSKDCEDHGSVRSNRSAKKEMLGSRASRISDPDDIQGDTKYKFNLSPTNSPAHLRRKSYHDEKLQSPIRKRSFDPKEKLPMPLASPNNLLSPNYDKSGAAQKVFKSFE